VARSSNANGMVVATGSLDGTTRLWDIVTGRELVRLYSFHSGADWLVVTPEGFFDGSEEGRESLAFRVGDNENSSVAAAEMPQRYHCPGVLARILAGKPIPPPPRRKD